MVRDHYCTPLAPQDDDGCINGALIDRGEDTPQRLAGHFLRGHAGSVAYDLACDGATWGMDEGVNRARHTLKVFFKSYYRRTSNRQRLAFAVAKSKGKQLRFEEALFL